MVAYHFPLLAVCLAASARALNLRAKQSRPLLAPDSGSVERCSLQQETKSELLLNHEKELTCMPSTLGRDSGVEFGSFTRRRKSSHKHRKQKRAAKSQNSISAQPRRPENPPTEPQQAEEIPLGERLADWGDGRGNASIGDECLQNCEVAGYCAWCGDGAACCKKDDADAPEECQAVENFYFKGGKHECVQPPVAFDDTVWGENSEDQLVVWVSGYPRSGSSILLSMVSATVDNNRDGGHTFSLFEPCHDGDAYDDKLKNRGCRQLLYDLSHCDFNGIEDLWGWRDPHSTNNYSKEFDAEQARLMCEEADIVSFKTVDWGHDLPDWEWLLDSRDNMKVLDMVRDPRAIYSSWKKLEPFKTLVETNDFYTLEQICDHFAMNIKFGDARVKRVVFEDLMTNPKTVTQHVYEFLGQDWTEDQEEWLAAAFNAAECPPPPPGMEGFTDCHTFTGVDPRGEESWRDILNATDLATFEHSANCQLVAKAYRYPSK